MDAMAYRPLGRCGTKVSVFGLGGWTTYGGSVADAGAIRAILKAAYEAGINFFDMADIYSNGEAERTMGQILKDFPRHTLVLSSKLYFPMSEDVNDRGLSRKHIMESVEKSLRRIGTEYLDVYFCHRFDEETPVEETARAMDDLVRQGKILYWGTSQWNSAQLKEARRTCDELGLYRPQVEQPEYSLLKRRYFEKEARHEAVRQGMGLVVWSPLASGVLSGKYDHGVPAGSRLAEIDWLKDRLATTENIERARGLKAVADSLRCSRAQLALAWAAAQDGVSSVITGATRVDQLKENLGALALQLTPEVKRKLDSLFPSA